MGLDAFVPCRCIHDGKARTPPPVPIGWDEDNGRWESARYLAAAPADRDAWLAEACAVSDWRRDACVHEDGEAETGWIGNWAMVARLSAWLTHVGRDRAPVLTSEMVDRLNGGHVPAGDCGRLRDEITGLRSPFVSIPVVAVLSGSGHLVNGVESLYRPWESRVRGGDRHARTWFEIAPDGSPCACVYRSHEELDFDALFDRVRPRDCDMVWVSDHYLVIPLPADSAGPTARDGVDSEPCRLVDVATRTGIDLSFTPVLQTAEPDARNLTADPYYDDVASDSWQVHEYVLRPRLLTLSEDCGDTLDTLARLAETGAQTRLGLYWC